MSDGWDIVGEYADTVSALGEDIRKLTAEGEGLRAALERMREEL